MSHKKVERNVGLMAILVALAVSIGGIAELIPLMVQVKSEAPSSGIEPYPPLALAGRDVYVREGCYVCHSQQVRPFRSETERYGAYSTADEYVYDRPFQWGSKRTGPDLARVGGRYSDEWQRLHLIAPRDLVPESNMPGFPWLTEREVDGTVVAARMRALTKLGHPYSEAQIGAAADQVAGKTEMDALIAYLQGLGRGRK